MLISCYFAGRKCSSEDFDWVYHFDYGNCFTFNGGKNARLKTVTQAGFQNGLILELFVGIPDHIHNSGSASGVEIFLSNHSNMAFKNPEVIIPMGFKTRLAVKKVVNQRLESPFSDCVQDVVTAASTDLFKLTKSLNISYSQDTCMNLCYQKYIIKYCRCYDPRYDPLSYPNNCISPNQFICLLDQFRNFLTGMIYTVNI